MGYRPEVLHRASGSPQRELLFLNRAGGRVAVTRESFVPLEEALLDAQSWTGLAAESVTATLTTTLPKLTLESPGLLPMR